MPDQPLVIHIGGWPGSGKRTIATELAKLCGGRVIDNHLILNPASAVFDRGQAGHVELRQSIRAVIYEAALTLPPTVPLILTDALAEMPTDWALFAPTQELAKKRGGRLRSFVLSLSQQENVRRLTAVERKDRGKLMDTDVLLGFRDKLELLRPEGCTDVSVDDLSPREAAEHIYILCCEEGEGA